jgi:uncharacterized membrane protein
LPDPIILPAVAPVSVSSQRLVALDLMRGLVMVLMALDHSSDAFNAGRLFTDSVNFYRPGMPLPAAQFLIRWVTHVCAPTFLFLAGVGLAYTVKKERARGKTERSIDAYLLKRGLLIAACELWVSYFIMPRGALLFQVLYAIGTSFLFMIPLRRLPNGLAFALAVSAIASLELASGALKAHFGAHVPLWATLLFVPGNPSPLVVAYPTLHWLALMLLGFSLGNHWIAHPRTQRTLSRQLLALGGLFLLVFGAIRGLNAYGNMWLYREDGSLVQWLHVSKYPPSIAYVGLELGICFLCLASFFTITERHAPRKSNPLLVLGQTPLFFYLLHFPLLVLSAKALGVESQLGIGAACFGAAAVVTVLYPVCRAYRSYKSAHKHSWVRYI